jgi:hypothetical protein
LKKGMKKLLALICIISFFANGALALAFDETCLHQLQERTQMPTSEVSDHDSIAALDEDKPCHGKDETKHSDRLHCDRNCMCVHGISNVPILDFELFHAAKPADPTRVRFGSLADTPAFFGQTPPERPPKKIS